MQQKKSLFVSWPFWFPEISKMKGLLMLSNSMYNCCYPYLQKTAGTLRGFNGGFPREAVMITRLAMPCWFLVGSEVPTLTCSWQRAAWSCFDHNSAVGGSRRLIQMFNAKHVTTTTDWHFPVSFRFLLGTVCSWVFLVWDCFEHGCRNRGGCWCVSTFGKTKRRFPEEFKPFNSIHCILWSSYL